MKFGRREDVTQRAVFDHLRLRAPPDTFFFHCPNGGARSPGGGRDPEGIRRRAGVPDVICIREDHVFALEDFFGQSQGTERRAPRSPMSGFGERFQ
jgi:hypothetical protein